MAGRLRPSFSLPMQGRFARLSAAGSGDGAFEIVMASPGLIMGESAPEQVWALAFFAGAVVLGLVFLGVVERLVPADSPPERK